MVPDQFRAFMPLYILKQVEIWWGDTRDALGSLFLLRGGAGQRKKFSGRGREKMLGAGRGNSSTPGHFRGGAGRSILENFRGQGARGQPIPPGSGRGVHP